MSTLSPAGKPGLHPRNPHQGRYDFAALTQAVPELARFVKRNPLGEPTIDFANAHAVKTLNRALLALHYGIARWDIPPGYLCPPIPGRADYLCHLADLLAGDFAGTLPQGEALRGLDVGVGANAIYPMLGRALFGWQFAGADIDAPALDNAAKIFAGNPVLSGGLDCRLQRDPQAIFRHIIRRGERFDFTLCNPPFHRSAEEAAAGSARKWNNLAKAGRNLGKAATTKPVLNFAGQARELWCPGGEAAFIRRMIAESRQFARQCQWFTTLVARSENLPGLKQALRATPAVDVRVIDMAQGQKSSRILAWTFHDEAARREWAARHWA
ncbi:23S rRNA (adenine(1618)-N(6))-methyltransferase RlmF [Chitinilyticum litopenaei]|uniref:23S rRNA (adenine(1618)-N(6))-methyltransferase RlmF n=1 Tax=Chitinilyticum litopenaei TaxID=1121276 RepID=UPI000402122E|nr:23S rRNA (adenine(1618)-N(6))-methyltransferase RlmF [Chitinilyticum litopenaei]